MNPYSCGQKNSENISKFRENRFKQVPQNEKAQNLYFRKVIV